MITKLTCFHYFIEKESQFIVGLSFYHRCADTTIEFDTINVLGNAHMDILKMLWLTKQKIYEKTGRAKEKEMEEAMCYFYFVQSSR